MTPASLLLSDPEEAVLAMLDHARQEGRRAAEEGLPGSANPYAPGRHLHFTPSLFRAWAMEYAEASS